MRLSTTERQQQIVQAALDLLAVHSVDRLTTRRVAARVGISQPALFRHFGSRDEILMAVLEHVRQSLSAEATRILGSALPPREAVEQVVGALHAFVGSNPGMPRLLFYDAATSEGEVEGSGMRVQLRQMLDMQRALLTDLLTKARDADQLPPGVDPRKAARLLLTLMQGRILAWHLDREERPPEDELAELLEFFWAGIGASASMSADAGKEGVGAERVLLHFDAREDLSRGVDPFESIRARLSTLHARGLLVLEVPFLPDPLLTLLGSEGWQCAAEATQDEHQIRIRGAEAAEVLDLRDLEPPEPMVKILEKTTTMSADDVLLARLPRVPQLLLPRLEERHCHYEWIETRQGEIYLAVRHTPEEAQA